MGQEESFVLDDVPHAGKHLLIQQDITDKLFFLLPGQTDRFFRLPFGGDDVQLLIELIFYQLVVDVSNSTVVKVDISGFEKKRESRFHPLSILVYPVASEHQEMDFNRQPLGLYEQELADGEDAVDFLAEQIIKLDFGVARSRDDRLPFKLEKRIGDSFERWTFHVFKIPIDDFYIIIVRSEALAFSTLGEKPSAEGKRKMTVLKPQTCSMSVWLEISEFAVHKSLIDSL